MQEDPLLPENIQISEGNARILLLPEHVVINERNARRLLLLERSTDMHEMYMHVNRVDLSIKALIALEVDDPEDSFFSI